MIQLGNGFQSVIAEGKVGLLKPTGEESWVQRVQAWLV